MENRIGGQPEPRGKVHVCVRKVGVREAHSHYVSHLTTLCGALLALLVLDLALLAPTSSATPSASHPSWAAVNKIAEAIASGVPLPAGVRLSPPTDTVIGPLELPPG